MIPWREGVDDRGKNGGLRAEEDKLKVRGGAASKESRKE